MELQVVATLIVQCDVETHGFLFIGDSQATGDRADQLEDHEREHTGIDKREQHRLGLDKHLRADVRHRAEPAQRRSGEHTRQQRADDAADAVYAKNVERIIVTKGALELGGGKEAQNAG